MSTNGPLDRRGFLKSVSATGLTLAAATSAIAAKTAGKMSGGRVVGANDRINIGVIGCGGRGSYVADAFNDFGKKNNACQIVAACDVYEKRKKAVAVKFDAKGYRDYRELLNQSDVDAVVVATPDHWHAKMAMDAMDKGKDVYLEKPMVHTNDEARQLVDTVKETKRILQVGSQTPSADIWWKAKKAIADGMIGQMIESQGSYHRNSTEGEWNWDIDPGAGPDGKGDDFIDWNMWLGSQFKLAPKRPWDADRFFRFRKYWDYSLGIASDLFFPMLLLEAVSLHASSIRALTSRAARYRVWEVALLTIHVAGYLTVVFLVLSPVKAVVFILVQQGLFGLYLGSSFAPNHKGMPILDADDRTDFLRRQVLTSRNVRGGWLTDFALGGLNYQIEHHLFPSMPRPNLRHAQGLVAAFCQQQELPYCETSLVGSYAQALRYLNTVGRLASAGPLVAGRRLDEPGEGLCAVDRKS